MCLVVGNLFSFQSEIGFFASPSCWDFEIFLWELSKWKQFLLGLVNAIHLSIMSDLVNATCYIFFIALVNAIYRLIFATSMKCFLNLEDNWRDLN